MVFKVQKVGGDERNRTADPLLARQVLSQLSYTPILNHIHLCMCSKRLTMQFAVSNHTVPKRKYLTRAFLNLLFSTP